MNKKIITRFAPSPTGFLHIGGVRTALICYLYAKKYNGLFFIRTEDTDLKNNIKKFKNQHIKNLNWLNIYEDGSILKKYKNIEFLQSNNINEYKKFLDVLLKNDDAYYCFCSNEQLDKEREAFKQKNKTLNFTYSKKCRSLKKENALKKIKNNEKYSIRVKNRNNIDLSFKDELFGNINIKANDVDDFVIWKNYNYPTYNFAVVIDDYLLKTTHVIRGQEHISNTPKQILIYKLLNLPVPKFLHLNLILNSTGKKLSKRDAHIKQYIEQYKNDGFLPSAIINFVSLLGFKPDKEQEIFTLKELADSFDLKKLSKSPSIFDLKKLIWFNKLYIKKMTDDNYLKYAYNFIENDFRFTLSKFVEILLFFKNKISTFSDLPVSIKNSLSFSNDVEYEISSEQRNELRIKMKEWLNLNQLSSPKKSKQLITFLVEQNIFLNKKDFYHSLRYLITGTISGIELYFLIYMLGENIIINRIWKNKHHT